MKKKSKETTCINPISIIGAKKHNLNNISVDIPRNQLVVLTGVSGSGKSSLAFNTLFAEGQRKYAESLNTYIRQFVNKMESAEVEVIHGLCPAIAIEQKVSSSSTKSTVGSLTEILDYLKLLFAHIGVIVSPKSGNIIQKYTAPKILTIIQNIPEKNTVCILSKIKLDKNSDNLKIHLESFIERGYTDIYAIQHDTNQRHIIQISNFIYKNDCTYYLLFSKFETKSNYTPEDLSDFVETMHLAFTEGNYEIYLDLNENNLQKYPNHLHQEDIYFEEPNPNLFSYSNSYGICKKCNGSGTTWDLDMNLIIPNKQLSVAEGAIIPWQDKKHKIWQDNFINDSKIHNFPIHTPIHNLTPTEYNVLIKGSDTLKGVNNFIQSVSKDFFEYHYYFKKKYYGNVFCPYCLGSRLRQEALYIQVCQKNIAEVLNMNIACFNTWLTNLVLDPHQRKISNRIIDELLKRVLTLKKVGLHYLTLNRSGESLSGGETQRIFLTKNINSNLSNSMYILDEPSIGLHPRDSLNLVMVLKELRDLQNTVIVVEHDEFIIKAADYIIDLGPFAGQRGGNIVAQGRFEDILNCPDSITAQCFKKEITLPIKTKRKWTNKIILEHANTHNLKNITVQFPLQALTVVCGVSGSGKTTLVKKILCRAILKANNIYNDAIHLTESVVYGGLKGDFKTIKSLEIIDQNSIGRNSRSTPISYIKGYDAIRILFAQTKLAKSFKFFPSHFSFNVEGGRCESCQGEGFQTIEMQFMSDIKIRCEVCNGKKFKKEILDVKYNNKNIDEVLNLTVDEALDFFKDLQDIYHSILPLQNVGLGYIKLGQSISTVSGGEAQRIKLASFLSKTNQSLNPILFIFDEPTTGLHQYDTLKLLTCFDKLIQNGHSVICIEHNTQVINYADWVIEIGPEGGDAGGYLLYEGDLAGIHKCSKSVTKKYLTN